MKILELTVLNFGIFRGKRQFDLSNNIVTIFGDNFSGKTTLSQAIYFAVSNKSLTTGLKPKDYVSINETNATIGIVCSYNNKKYRIYRSSRGDERHEVYDNNSWQILEDDNAKLPSLNQQQWQIGCFLKEEELGEFITKTPANRRDLLNQLLGVNQILRVQKSFIKVRQMAKREEKTVLAKQSSLRVNEDEDRSFELEELKKKLILIEEKLLSPKNEESKQSLYNEWQEQKDTIQNSIDSKNEKIQKLLAGFQNIEEITDTLQQIANWISEQKQYEQVLESLKGNRIKLSENLRQAAKGVSDFENLKGQNICPTCQQPISKEHIQAFVTENKKIYKTISDQLSEITDKEHKALTKVEELKELAERETDLSRRLEQIKLLNEELGEEQKRLELVEGKLESVSRVAEKLDNDINIKEQLENTRSRISELERHQALFQENREKISQVNIEADKATHKRLLSEWAADAIVLTLEHIIGASLKKAESNVINCLSGFNLSNLEDLTIELEKSKLMPDIDNRNFYTLSGSEKAIVYLGMKIALSKLMSGAGFMVLDNPTQHLDNKRKTLMKDYLLSQTNDKQIIILTNDRYFADLITEGIRINL